MREADVDRDGRIGLDDFVRFYDRLARYALIKSSCCPHLLLHNCCEETS
jgi:hypothetical protein